MNQCTTQCQLLFHSAGKCARTSFFKGFYLLINIFNQVVVLFNGRIEERSEERQVFLYAQILVE